SPGERVRRDPLELAFHGIAITYLVVTALGATRPFWAEVHDDFTAYLEFPRRLLQTGTFVEPMSSRRIATLGGGVYLQSLLFPLWGPAAVPLVDVGLGQLLAWGAALAIRPLGQGRAHRAVRLGAPLFVLALGSAHELYSHAPMRLVFGLVVVLLAATAAAAGKQGARAGDFAVVAASGVALVSLRNSLVAFALLVACGWAVVGLVRRDRRLARDVIVSAAAMIALLLPWCAVSWRSSGTPFYPLLEGTFRSGAFSAPMALGEKLAFVGDVLARVGAHWVLLVGIGAWLLGAGARAVAVGAGAAVVTCAATAFSLTGFDSYNIFRYSEPMLLGALAFAACALGAALADGGVAGRGRRAVAFAGASMVAVAVLVPLRLVVYDREVEVWCPRRALRATAAFAVASAQALREPFAPFASKGSEVYASAQAAMPRGAAVAAAVARPFLWDLGRQRIDSVDIPGVVSPAPGLPSGGGADALAAYLRQLGYEFLAFTPPATGPSLYQRSRWQALARGHLPMWRDLGGRVGAFLDDVDALSRERRVVYTSGEIVVVDLR
ncbi:MAG TPA: hypothetical protein VLT61_00305, partial [Anaeromyxobacteraceae bacterium]|nr:hypothetical protein [Anaeromyxobacteraceae bacterium]